MQRVATILLVLSLLSSCGGMSFFGGTEITPGNTEGLWAPVLASAGGDREVLRGYTTYLDGRGTHHPLGAAFSVRWEQVGGEPVYLSNATALTPSLVTPLDEQTLVFRLTANDGRFASSADVKLFVRNQPQGQAPRVRAAADRFLAVTEPAEPTADDVADAGRTGTQLDWRPVVVDPLDDSAFELPAIFTLHGEADGLSAAPDFLLLWPYTPKHLGHRAPLSNLEAKSTVEPGEEFSLDAAGSADPNGDPLHFRWEQTRGEPILPPKATGSRLMVTAPWRPQELSFRVVANDGLLSGAPSEVHVIAGPGLTPNLPPVNPGADRRTRPGRTVLLDAQAGVTNTIPGRLASLFRWEQTFGQALPLEVFDDGRYAAFVAPAAPAELAFAVSAESEVAKTFPAVTRVSVVKADNNLPPRVSLSTAALRVSAGTTVLVQAKVIDPEEDPLLTCAWTTESEPDIEVQLIPGPLCTSASQSETSATFVAPPSGTTVLVTLTALDELDALGSATLEIVSD